MEKEFIPYEQALALKELGFDEPCFGNYNNLTDKTRFVFGKTNEGSLTWNKVPGTNDIVISNERILSPLYQQAFRFFREKYGLHIVIENMIRNNNDIFYFLIKNMKNHVFIDHSIQVNGFDYKTPEDSELECLKKLIEIVKQK